MSDTDFAGLTEGLCIRFWGKPTDKTAKTLRWGSGGSRSFNIAEMVWYDHEAGKGGGAIALVMREVGTDRDGALAWMQKEGLIEARHARADAQQRQEAPPTSEDRPEPEQPPAGSAEPVAKAIEGYRYTDGDGETLYEVIRYHFQYPDGTWQPGKAGNPKKTFKQRRPDGKGGFIWGLGDVPHTLWRRQELEQAIERGDTIYLPEGEKDAKHTLLPWGLEATTNSGGAQNWRPEFADLLRGADVVILGDDDEPGQKRVDTIARDLRGKAKRVRAIYSWGGPKDVTDWREAGGTKEQFLAMVEALPDWRPRPPRSGFGAQTSSSIAKKPVVYDWLVKHLIERNGILILAGESMAGKSFLIMDMGMKIARGLEYAGHKVRQGAVIHMAVEDGRGTELRHKGYRKANGISADADIPYVIMDPFANGGLGFSLMSDEVVDKFIAECLEWKAFYGSLEFIIIDTLAMATEGMDENSSGEASKVLGRVNRIRERTGATVAVVHHMNAGGTKVRGSTAIVANVPNVIELRQLMTIPQNRREEPRPILDGNGRPIRRARLAKNKNGVANKGWSLVLEEVKLDELDEDGQPFETMVCARPARNSNAEMQEDVTKLGGDQKLVYDALVAAQTDEGMDMPAGTTAAPQIKRCVSNEAFKARIRKGMSFASGEDDEPGRDKELQAFLKRTTTALINAGYMGRDNDAKVVWWTGKSDRPRPRRQEAEPPPTPEVPAAVLDEIKNSPVPF